MSLHAVDTGRVLQPLYRESLEAEFREVGWDYALNVLVQTIERCLEDAGPQSIAMYGSGQLHSEDYFVAQKLMKGALGTNNFDANSRLCMSSAVAGYRRSLGSDGPPCSYDDLDLADLVVIIGANMDACHPVLFDRLMARKQEEGDALRIVVVDPRKTATAARADLHLSIAPGTDLALLNGLAHTFIATDGVDTAFLDARCSGFEAFREQVSEDSLASAARHCGVAVDDLERFVALWRTSERVMTLWSMGVNQSVEGTATVEGIINLHLLTGQLAKPGTGPFSLTGQPNAMGGREAGGLAHLLPGYRLVASTEDRAFMESFWDFEPGSIPSGAGLTAVEQILAMESGEIELFWVLATNPLVSFPNLTRVRSALKRCPMTVVQEAYRDAETLSLAHMVLPAAHWSERDGVMTNSERRITLCPGFRAAPGSARPDWAILADVGRRLGYQQQFDYRDASHIFDELASATAGRICDYSGLNHGILARQGPQQWPYPQGCKSSSGAKPLYADREFPTSDGRARLHYTPSKGLAEPVSKQFPFVLTTGRVPDQWHTMTRTGRVPRLLRRDPTPLLDIHPVDADEVGINDGALARLVSRRGSLTARVRVTEKCRPGVVFLPIHWGASQDDPCEVNRLMHEHVCPTSKQPELKACAVALVPVPG